MSDCPQNLTVLHFWDEKTHKPWLEAFVHNVDPIRTKEFQFGELSKTLSNFIFQKNQRRDNNLFLILCLICLKRQQFYGGSHQKTLPILFFKKKKEQHKFFLKLCLSLKGPATIWEGAERAESFQNFLSIFLFNIYIYFHGCVQALRVGVTKIPSNFSFQKMSRKKKIILFSFLCTKGLRVVILSMGEGTKNFLCFFFSKISTRKKTIHFYFYVKRGRHHKFPRTFLFKIDQRGGRIYVKVLQGSDFVGGGGISQNPLQSFLFKSFYK